MIRSREILISLISSHSGVISRDDRLLIEVLPEKIVDKLLDDFFNIFYELKEMVSHFDINIYNMEVESILNISFKSRNVHGVDIASILLNKFLGYTIGANNFQNRLTETVTNMFSDRDYRFELY